METWSLRKSITLVVLLALAGVAALYWASLAQRPKGGDAQQIQAIMARGERAIEARDISDAMALVSKEYRDEQGLRYGSLRMLATRELREAESIEITVPQRFLHVGVDPDGKHATATARVDLRVITRAGAAQDLSSSVTLQFRKEPVRYYLLFPGEEWRLVKMGGWQGLVWE